MKSRFRRWEIWTDRHLTTVYFLADLSAKVERSLINHDGLPPNIMAYATAGRVSMRRSDAASL